MKVIGYARVSTEEQAVQGQSLDAQRAKLEAYAKLYDLDLVGVIVDAGASAKSLNRPGLQDALAKLRRGEVAGLVIAKLDRLTRSVGDWQALRVLRGEGRQAAVQRRRQHRHPDRRRPAGS